MLLSMAASQINLAFNNLNNCEDPDLVISLNGGLSEVVVEVWLGDEVNLVEMSQIEVPFSPCPQQGVAPQQLTSLLVLSSSLG